MEGVELNLHFMEFKELIIWGLIKIKVIQSLIKGDIYGIYIGDSSLCSRFGLFQPNIANQHSDQFIECFQPTLQ